MKIFRSLVIFSPFLLSACLDDSLSKCQERLSKGMDLIALPYCEKAADGGDASAQELFAKLLLKRGETERAVEYFGKSANQKNASAMLALAEYYEVVDPEKALFYYKRACAANELKACEKEERLTRKQQQQSQQEALALEKAKAETAALEKEKLAVEKEKLAAQIKAEELRRKKEEEQALKQKIGNRKFYNGLAKYKEGDLWGHINQKGEMVIPAQFAYAADFYDGLAAVKTTEGKWGYIYPSGNYAIFPQFSCVIYFNEGLAAVTNEGYGQNCEGGKWGFIDKSGNWVIDPVLDRVETVFRNGVAKVIYNGVTGYINKQGQWVDMPTNTNDSNSGESLPFISPQDIKSAYANAIPRFQSFGVVGSKIWVKDCYQKSNYKLGCYHFDQLISNIYKSVDASTLSADAYFSQANVEERARTYIFELKQLSYTDFQRVVNNTIFQLDQNRSLIDKYWK